MYKIKAFELYVIIDRIDDAMEASEMASKMDSNNKDVNMMVCRIKVVMGARSKGNELFKAANYPDACVAYGEGLDHDPFNSVLLCNRAACRTKMGQFEKAVEDCTMALNIRPTYNKARLRRADCNFKVNYFHTEPTSWLFPAIRVWIGSNGLILLK